MLCCWCIKGIGVGRSLACWRFSQSGSDDFFNVISGNIFVVFCHFLVNFLLWDLSTNWNSVLGPHILWKSHCESWLLGKIIYRIAHFARENTKQDFCCQICSLKYDYNNHFLQLNLLSSISRTYFSQSCLFFRRSHVGQFFGFCFVLPKLYYNNFFIYVYRRLTRISGSCSFILRMMSHILIFWTVF